VLSLTLAVAKSLCGSNTRETEWGETEVGVQLVGRTSKICNIRKSYSSCIDALIALWPGPDACKSSHGDSTLPRASSSLPEAAQVNFLIFLRKLSIRSGCFFSCIQ